MQIRQELTMLVRKKPTTGFTKNRGNVFIELGSTVPNDESAFGNYCLLLVNFLPFADGVCPREKPFWNSTRLLRETNV